MTEPPIIDLTPGKDWRQTAEMPRKEPVLGAGFATFVAFCIKFAVTVAVWTVIVLWWRGYFNGSWPPPVR